MDKATNGNKQGDNVMSLEMEQLHPEPTTVRYPQKLSLLDQIFLLARLYVESYPRIASFLGFVVFTFCIYAAIVYSKPPLTRNQLEHDYKDIDRDSVWKLSQMDHWCLFVSTKVGVVVYLCLRCCVLITTTLLS